MSGACRETPLRTPWSERHATTLSDLYDADLRRVQPKVRSIAATYPVPHPLAGVEYAPSLPAREAT